MIRNDLHVHSIRSLCGVHTLLEIVEIAARKGMRLVNVCDHGEASGQYIKFDVINDKRRSPGVIKSIHGAAVTVLTGIEANILDINGRSDFPTDQARDFNLVSAGFHSMAKELALKKSLQDNTRALENYLKRYPLDIFTHPCMTAFPLNIEKVVDLSIQYGFALEVNNTALRLGKVAVDQLKKMIHTAREKGAVLCENSDGHTFIEIGENEEIGKFLKEVGLNGDDLFFNRDDGRLDRFLAQRKKIRETIGGKR